MFFVEHNGDSRDDIISFWQVGLDRQITHNIQKQKGYTFLQGQKVNKYDVQISTNYTDIACESIPIVVL